MVRGQVIPHGCPTGCHALSAAREAARRARQAARTEIRERSVLMRQFVDGLYDLVDRQTRERYEGRRQQTG